MTSFDPSAAGAQPVSRPDGLPDVAEPIDHIELREDIVDADGEVIGEHVETIDLVRVDGEDVVVIDDVRMITDDEGDLLIEETVATFDERGDVIVDETITIIDAEGDVLVEERIIAADAAGETVVLESAVVIDGDELDEIAIASRMRDDLDGVEAALARLDDGSYGRCESCGEEIDDEILAHTPHAVRCGAHLL